MALSDVIDLSHQIDRDMPMFPGTPSPDIEEFLTRAASRAHYAGDTAFVIHRYQFVGNSGTYLDAPFHRFADGLDLAHLPLEKLVALRGVVLDVASNIAGGQRAVESGDVRDLEVAGKALLIRTGWDARWPHAAYLDPNPYLAADAAQHLADGGVALVGIDTWNIDDTGDGRRPAHTILLRAGIPIVENLCHLDRLPPADFQFNAAPLPMRGGSACPVRAYAVL